MEENHDNEKIYPEQNLNDNKKDETSNKEQDIKQEKETILENQKPGEIIEVKKKKIRKTSYITGTIGAILGALIFILPWVLRYILARKNFALTLVSMLCATLIPVGAYWGYKIFRGKVSKTFPRIITIVSLLVIVMATAIICPLYLMFESGFPITLENYIGLYSRIQAEVRSAIIEDTVAGLVFTLIGTIVIRVFFIKKQLKNLISEEEIKVNEEAQKQLKEKIETIKKACLTLNCMSRDTSVAKKVILKELKNTCNLKRKKCKQYFLVCKLAKLLKKHKGKYYYDENNELTQIQNARKLHRKFKRHKLAKAIIALALLAIIIAATTSYILLKREMYYIIPDTNIRLSISNSQALYETAEEITEEFGAGAAQYYNFVVKGNEEQSYNMYGQLMKKSDLPDYDFSTLMQVDRDYYASYYTEDMTSEVTDLKLGNKDIKTYNYMYMNNEQEVLTAVVYLYQSDEHYLFINVFDVENDVELTEIDVLIEKLLN